MKAATELVVAMCVGVCCSSLPHEDLAVIATIVVALLLSRTVSRITLWAIVVTVSCFYRARQLPRSLVAVKRFDHQHNCCNLAKHLS